MILYKLSPEEVSEKATELADLVKEQWYQAEEWAERVKQRQEEESALNYRIKQLAEQVQSGVENRP